jgi:hypothetical protein
MKRVKIIITTDGFRVGYYAKVWLSLIDTLACTDAEVNYSSRQVMIKDMLHDEWDGEFFFLKENCDLNTAKENADHQEWLKEES